MSSYFCEVTYILIVFEGMRTASKATYKITANTERPEKQVLLMHMSDTERWNQYANQQKAAQC